MFFFRYVFIFFGTNRILRVVTTQVFTYDKNVWLTRAVITKLQSSCCSVAENTRKHVIYTDHNWFLRFLSVLSIINEFRIGNFNNLYNFLNCTPFRNGFHKTRMNIISHTLYVCLDVACVSYLTYFTLKSSSIMKHVWPWFFIFFSVFFQLMGALMLYHHALDTIIRSIVPLQTWLHGDAVC